MTKKQYKMPLVKVVQLRHASPILVGSNYEMNRSLQQEEEVDEAW